MGSKRARFNRLLARMVKVSKASLPELLSRRPFSVVHVDSDWDGNRDFLAEKIRREEPQFEQTVSFGYVDCDQEQEYAAEIGIVNVPSIAYYKGLKLIGVVIGIQQDVSENIGRVMNGETLDQTNTLCRG